MKTAIGLIWLCLGMGAYGQNYVDYSDGYFGARFGHLEVEDVEDGSLTYGLVVGWFLGPLLTVEASVDGSDMTVVIDSADVDIAVYDAGRKSYAFQANLLVHPFSFEGLRPFGLVGLGYYLSDYSSAYYDGESSGDGGFQAGFGFDFWTLDENVAITLDGRWLFTQEEEYADDRVESDGLMITVGAKYRF